MGDIKIGTVGEIIPESWATSTGISTLPRGYFKEGRMILRLALAAVGL